VYNLNYIPANFAVQRWREITFGVREQKEFEYRLTDGGEIVRPNVATAMIFLLKSWATQNFITIKTSLKTNDLFVSNLVYYFNN
jgi:hypothetical protein